eukprot:TRINITY_DN603_c0_g1_i3.p2 TRINITY_DN603_c0_g1~~TRINITY_DN603_c0_g1_i3.p2  ORF type:complete len:265 (+),score=11.46 TRINITY_DN603_c0_g1_i3:184-978(+)
MYSGSLTNSISNKIISTMYAYNDLLFQTSSLAILYKTFSFDNFIDHNQNGKFSQTKLLATIHPELLRLSPPYTEEKTDPLHLEAAPYQSKKEPVKPQISYKGFNPQDYTLLENAEPEYLSSKEVTDYCAKSLFSSASPEANQPKDVQPLAKAPYEVASNTPQKRDRYKVVPLPTLFAEVSNPNVVPVQREGQVIRDPPAPLTVKLPPEVTSVPAFYPKFDPQGPIDPKLMELGKQQVSALGGTLNTGKKLDLVSKLPTDIVKQL